MDGNFGFGIIGPIILGIILSFICWAGWKFVFWLFHNVSITWN